MANRKHIGLEVLRVLTIPAPLAPEPPPPPPPTPSPIASGSWVDVSRDGSTIAVGQSTPSFTGGAIHMCRGDDFLTVTTLTAPGGFGSVNEYGNGVATNEDGSIVVCGCLRDGESVDGYAAVRYGTGWANEIELEPAGSSIFLCYGGGIPVAISDDGSIIVLKDSDKIYVCSGTDWEDILELTPSGADSVWCVAISGDGTVIAAGNGYDKVHVFSGEDYATDTVVTPADLGSFPEFGWTTALNSDGSILVAGNPSNGPSQRGAAYIFTGEDWATEQKFFVDAEFYNSPSEYYGAAVDISADGSVAAFGAYNRIAEGSGNPSSTGIVFRESGSGYSVETEVYEPNAASFASFGLGVALSEDGAVMGVVAGGGNVWAIT